MNRRGAGVGFCLIAALLFLSRYITAAIYISNMLGSWGPDIFVKGLAYVGGSLTTLSVISLIAGIIYLLFAEIKKEG